MELANLLSDIKILHDAADQDYHAGRYEPYPRYLLEFNQFVKKAKIFGINDINLIEDVPSGQKGATGRIGTDSEKAKHREIVVTSARLLERLHMIHNQRSPLDLKDIDIIQNILFNFQKVANQLLRRHDRRETLTIKDEYDVQDLLHSLLKLHYDDIRPEEYTPSYAGNSSRMDFLLKNEQIVIETKKTRDKLGQKEIGEQLLIDIGKYSNHPDCKTLICFVYDPDHIIYNPFGVETDLNNKSDDKMKVIVVITPK